MINKFNLIFEQLMKAINFQIQQITTNEMKDIIDANIIENHNPKIDNDLPNVKKLLGDQQLIWLILKDSNSDKIIACAAITEKENNIAFINQLQAFETGCGCGSELLLKILNDPKYSMVYLNSDWSQKQSLNDYYRREIFGLTEYICHRDGYDVHYFYKNNSLKEPELNKFIQEQMK